MGLRTFIRRLVGDAEAQRYRKSYDFQGANFVCTQEQLSVIKLGKADDLITQQHILLRMLVEEGNAFELPNGFRIPSDIVVSLDQDSRELLELPEAWVGSIKADFKGTTGRTIFALDVEASYPGGQFTHAYQLKGPVIRFSEEKQYLLSGTQLEVFEALETHRESAHSEYDNLVVVAALQNAQECGVPMELGHFKKLKIHTPESVSIEAELDANGNLILTPQLGQDATHEEMQRVLGQLREGSSSLRVNDEIILIDEHKMAGIQEILRNRVVTKDKLDDFYRNPTAFIDGSLVNLELGFSARVRGAARFRHAYFGETDESGIDWFGRQFSAVNVHPVSKVLEAIEDEEQLLAFEAIVHEARATGADEVEFNGKVVDISDDEQVRSAINDLRNRGFANNDIDGDCNEGEDNCDLPELDEDTTPVVVDIALNDDDLETPSEVVERQLRDVYVPEEQLCWDNYQRRPFPHQIEGVRWLLGLAGQEDGLGGGLLADDMGLGKTFMSLAAIEHLYREWEEHGKTVKPCLIVAPLSLLQNWKDEVEKTFHRSPFKDIVILQSDADLNKFRVSGVETRNQRIDDEEAAIRYSLKVGDDFISDRLDVPKRLVITTYQTLRDYQFSLCAIDWGVVAFDEAQNIKNPNALQTRAAKGLKAEFRLLATGTPVENSLADFWCIMDTACPGYLGSYQAFRERYVAPILRAAGDEVEEIRARVGRTLRDTVGALMLRRLKEDNLEGLPQKRLFVGVSDSDWEYLDTLSSVMSGGQLDSYDSVLQATAQSEQNAALTGLQQLRDVSLHHRLLLGGRLEVPTGRALKELMGESGKFRSLLSLLNDIKKREEKAIIFCVNKRLQGFLSLALARYFDLMTLPVINGDVKGVAKTSGGVTRKSLIEDFESKPGFNVIIMSPVAAGVGLTVVGANNVIHLERHWNPAKEAQATDRVYRIGQTKDVNVYIPIVSHPELMSFDENLHQLLSKKTLLRDAVVTPEQVMPDPEGFTRTTFSNAKIITSDDLKHIDWQQFEALVAEVFAHHWRPKSVELTASGSDHGADAVLELDEGLALLQCKYTGGGIYSGYNAVKEVHGARVAYENALNKRVSKLVFVTNASRLGAETRKVAKDYVVEIISGADLELMVDQARIPFSKVLARLHAKRRKI
ncbi:SNF2-related protein [uncultured Thalassolituus sp.]|uniref:SNF2-related protein n=1 Tax=uncultured Thalassolituus sp. TaxID=285273 RepID=UPI0026124418|nr:SNF2-related protein [uncultured Thalassolituus sp.]